MNGFFVFAVIALDLDPIRLRCARRNAEIYGVADRINFMCIDFFHFCKMENDKVKSLWNHSLDSRQRPKNSKKKLVNNFEKAVEVGEEVGNKKLEIEEEENALVKEEPDDEDELSVAAHSCGYVPRFDAVFLSPPWGGPAYRDAKVTLKS
ncbi:unnamed protein product [Gongylonema pulchrum]|uniref:Trimethylguanosine synthase n=1 Tax=Gongylonema pulchrum TaxID=637853 RepID=A0A183DJ44_9BILA|nr:unnamed protein product [Gongylonema pulchrum]